MRFQYKFIIGDACDKGPDKDSDGEPDISDNCPDVHNSDQLDTDKECYGDECDDDIDGDGIKNINDKCPKKRNIGYNKF